MAKQSEWRGCKIKPSGKDLYKAYDESGKLITEGSYTDCFNAIDEHVSCPLSSVKKAPISSAKLMELARSTTVGRISYAAVGVSETSIKQLENALNKGPKNEG